MTPSAATAIMAMGQCIGSEEWRPILDFPGYEASSLGRIRSVKRWRQPRILKPSLTRPHEYYSFEFSTFDGGRRRRKLIHVVVAETFLGPRPPGHEVRHLDGDPFNNRVDNLRWGTHSENQFDQVRHGRHRNAHKTHCPQGHAYDAANTRIQPKGSRICRKCSNQHTTAYRRRKRLQERAA